MESMAAARKQIDRQLAALEATQRMVRQEEITAEIINWPPGKPQARNADGRARRSWQRPIAAIVAVSVALNAGIGR